MSFSMFYLVQRSNRRYLEHLIRSQYPATEGTYILPYHFKSVSPCEHNLPTPCPPSTPILVQHTNSGRNLNVQMHHNAAGSTLQTLHANLLYRLAIDTLNSLNGSPAVEAISPIHGSRHDHSFYICQRCYPKITHIMNIGATLHHITHDHTMARYENRDKLTHKAAGHLAELRYLLQQTNDRHVFSIVRSSSDSLPITKWRGNNANFKLEITRTDRKQQSTIGNETHQKRTPPTTNLQSGQSEIRDVDTYLDPDVTMTMINTGLSLDLSHTSPNISPRLKYAEEITGPVESPKRKAKKKNSETHTVATDTPRSTRNGGVRKGIFDRKSQTFKRFHS